MRASPCDLTHTLPHAQISLWDLRQGEGGGCVQRLSVAQGCPVYSLQWCAAEGGLLGCAGADRAVSLFEPRK